ncbi:MAG: hypothetical protein ACRC8S_11600 [Fimbriiglobus sp.]
MRWMLLGLVVLMGGLAWGQDDLPPRERELPPDPLFPERREPASREPGTWPQNSGAFRDDNRAPRYRVWWYPEEQVRNSPSKMGIIQQQFDLPFPIFLGEEDILAGSFQLRHLNFQTRAILPDTGNPFPRNLWNINLNLAYIHRFNDGSSLGVIPSFGSPSDKPFHSGREYNYGILAFWRVPAAYEGDFWNFGVFYNANSQIPFPIPGIAYEYNPNPDVRISLGIPFSVMLRFDENWRIDFSYRPITVIRSQLTYEPRPGFQVYGGYDWDNEGYSLEGRNQRQDRFFRQEMRLFGGVRMDLGERISLDLSGGYAFERNFGVGRSSVRYDYDRVNLAPGGFLSAWLLIPF